MKRILSVAALAAAALTFAAPDASAQAPLDAQLDAACAAPGVQLDIDLVSYDWRYRSNCGPRYYVPRRSYYQPRYRPYSYSYSYPRYQRTVPYRGYRAYGGGYCY